MVFILFPQWLIVPGYDLDSDTYFLARIPVGCHITLSLTPGHSLLSVCFNVPCFLVRPVFSVDI